MRRCHGDLHLGNIVLIDGKPVLFDAIEFDDRIATVDVFYDLAFLLMDLIERGLHRAANIVFNRYLTDTQRVHDLDALAALPLFMSVRAAIRAKVTAARRRHNGSRTELEHERARLCRAGAKIVGAGQAATDCDRRALWHRESRCSRVHWRRRFRHCRARWCCAAMSSARRCSAPARPNGCRDRLTAAETTAKVYATLAEKARRVTAAGHSAIVDAVFAQPSRAGRHRKSRRRRCVPRPVPHRQSREPASPASAAAPAMLQTPTQSLRASRKNSISATSIGRRSMPPARRRKRSSAPKAMLGCK